MRLGLNTGKIVPPKLDLDALLASPESVSDTNKSSISVTNTNSVSSTKKPSISDTKTAPISDTKDEFVSSTNVSDTNISATKGQRMNQWKKENKDTLRIDLPKGAKAVIQSESMKRGISVTKLIKEAIKEYIKNHPV